MNIKYALSPLLAVLIWAINTSVNKLAADVIDSAAISFYRWLLAGLLLAIFFARPVWRHRQRAIPFLPKLFVLGILGMVLYQCLAYVAAQSTSVTNMGVIASLMPLIALGLGVTLLGNPATIGGVVGGVLSLSGLAYLLSQGEPALLLSHGLVLGDGLMLIASFSYAAYSVLLKRWAIPLPIWHSLLIQVWLVLPVLLVYYLWHAAPPLTLAGLPLVLYAGIPASILAPFFWMHGVARLGPSRATALMNLLPIFTVIVAVLFLGEHLHRYHVIGGGITLLGVVLAQYLKQPLGRRPAAPGNY
ncbi:DMT family transporter [Herbaspirillum sp. RTI4]|uniref:DMT family transporter n=1 Tax=Herbaspirillum sp. RTI4 TaxID=3048640 RepID=UPI002AB52524|nr:DMT family transporter [Herbaspirillum sp. RTI4]MDY7577006.1 DMT family transporter [Herbaspirillum sp. RTI4]MEA9982091.1 DMT family transporter [Herbaspirillum sp. RTI4]